MGGDGCRCAVAGNGQQTFSGDGGPALSASLDSPTGLALDPTGRLYIADTGNGRVRLVDTSGLIQTVAVSLAVIRRAERLRGRRRSRSPSGP